MPYPRRLRISGGVPILIALLLVGALAMTLARSTAQSSDADIQPENVFPILAQDARADDTVPDHPHAAEMMEEATNIRFLREVADTQYFISGHVDHDVCLWSVSLTSASAGGACTYPWHAAQEGLWFGNYSRPGPAKLAVAVPEGYDRVVDADGNLVGDIENQLFVMEYELGDEPDALFAEGEAGRLELGTPDPFRSEH